LNGAPAAFGLLLVNELAVDENLVAFDAVSARGEHSGRLTWVRLADAIDGHGACATAATCANVEGKSATCSEGEGGGEGGNLGNFFHGVSFILQGKVAHSFLFEQAFLLPSFAAHSLKNNFK
jgi:hypothetical protein